MNDLTRDDYSVENPARFSVEEFQQLVDSHVFEGSKVELVEGVIVRMSPATSYHFRLQREVFRSLDRLFGDGLHGRLAGFEVTVQFEGRTLRDIDVAVIAEIPHGTAYFSPDNVLLAIEVSVSTQHYDLNDKREEYARAGIPHYWVIDVLAQRIHIMSNPLDGDYTERHLAQFGDEIGVPGTDGSIRIGEAD